MVWGLSHRKEGVLRCQGAPETPRYSCPEEVSRAIRSRERALGISQCGDGCDMPKPGWIPPPSLSKWGAR